MQSDCDMLGGMIGRIYSHCAGSAFSASNVLAGCHLGLYSNMRIKSAHRNEALDTQPLTFGRGWSWAGWRAARAAGTAESSSCWSSTPWRPPRYHCSILSKSGGLGNTWKSQEGKKKEKKKQRNQNVSGCGGFIQEEPWCCQEAPSQGAQGVFNV